MAKILILEDDKLFNETLQDFLEEDGYDVYFALDPYSALDITYNHNFDLYLFDVNIPYENGFELLKKLRDSGDMTPTIFITSRDDKSSLNLGFLVGADDYIKKPFNMNELLARVKAVLKRHNISATIISYKNFHLDFENRNLTYENIKISLTPSEFRLLEMFFKNQKRTLSRDEIMENLEIQNEKSVNVAINRLNHKIGNIIESVRGIGYKLK